jgi:hypothetical protein
MLAKVQYRCTNRQRMKDVGIEDDDEKRNLVVSSELDIEGVHFREGVSTLYGPFAPVGEYVAQTQATMASNPLVRQLVSINDAR